MSGESNYRSVNLTWEIEDAHENVNQNKKKFNSKRNFIIYYCEMQSWGPNKCKSKVMRDDKPSNSKDKMYSMIIDNLRMATKYSFHLRKQNKMNGEQKASGRNFNADDLNKNGIAESIIIPTKGC